MKTLLHKAILLCAFLSASILLAQGSTINGTVNEANGPLPGATIIIKGTSTGTQTDFDGAFSIKASPSDILVVSYVGFKSQEITVGSQKVISVILESDNALDEVVVVGYYSAKKSAVTAAVSKVSGKEIESVPIASFDQILQGRLPGLEVSSGSGQPGAAARVRIRGSSSVLGNSDPLYIVDGVQIDANSFASLNANDFEDISVLKDAAAKSQYGSRGASGVILITTKKGSRNSGITINLRTFTGISEAPTLETRVLNASEFLTLSRDLGLNGVGGLSDADISQQVSDLNGFSPTNDFLRTGRTNSYELTASGGSENSNFFSSINYFEQEATAPNSDLQRITTRLNLGYDIGDKFSIQLNNFVGFTRTNAIPSDGGVNLANPFLIPFIGNPTVPIFNDDGTFNVGAPTLSRLAPNVLEDLENGIRENEEVKIIVSANAKYKFTDWFDLSYNVGIDFEDDFNVTALNPNTFRGQTIPAITDAGAGAFGNQTETSIRDANLTSTLSANFYKTFNEKHSVNASALFEVINRDFRSSNFTGFGIEPALFGFANSITQGTVDNGLIPTVGGLRLRSNIVSLFANAGYSYDDRYGVTASIRRDDSSRIDPEFSDVNFYSVGVRWSLDNEAFLENATWINQLKLRASFGTSGNDESAGFNDFIQQLASPIFLGRRQLALAGLANTNQRWETKEDLNIGLDFGFLNNAITGSLEYYESKTEDLLTSLNVPASFGDTAINQNVGSLDSEGFEVNVNFRVISNNDFQLDIFGNGAYNFNRITDLGPQVDQFVNGTSIVRVGEQLGSHFIVESAGVNPSNGEQLYRDLDGNITNVFSGDLAKTGFGSSEPLYTGGFGFNASYKGFSLSSLFAFQAEVTRFNNTSFFLENFNFLGSGLNQSTTILNYWQQPGDITDIPAPFVNGVATQRQFTSADLEDASFLRLRDVTLAYTVPLKFIDKTFLKNARIYARGVNILTFTEFSGLDPEDNNNISQFEFPNAKQYTFGVDLQF